MSIVSENSNFFSLIDLKLIDNFLFTIGFEGRICKWDSRKLDKPIILHDIVV